MKRMTVPIFLGLVLTVGAACGGRTAGPTSPSTPGEQPTLKLSTAHFRLLADRASSSDLAGIADSLEAEYSRITSDLGVASMPLVSVYVWQDEASFYADMQSRAGTVFQGASGWTPNTVTMSMRVIPGELARTAVHEFAHLVSLAVNASFGNNPRWLWETVALYESHGFIDPMMLDYMRSGNIPTLADLNSALEVSGRVYAVGFVLGEYIVQRWGPDGLVRLIRGNGNVSAVLGVTVGEFESGWRAFLHEKYNVPA